MSDIKPFKGYIPAPEYSTKLPSLPYDVMNTEEARKMAEGNPYSFLRVVKPEINFPPKSVDVYSKEVYEKGAEVLNKFIEDGILVQAEKPCFYVYRQKMGNVTQTGLVAGASLEEYDSGLIKKHEFTRREKEDDRVNHVNILNANTGPGFLTYAHKDSINAIIDKITSTKPQIDFTSEDGVVHTLWVVDNQSDIDNLVEEFKKIPAMYIADGHHRSAASGRVYRMRKEANPNHDGTESYNHYLSVIFPDDQLYVMDYNRVLKTMNGHSEQDIMDAVKENFDVSELSVASPEEAKPTKRGEFAMYLGKKWYRLSAKSEIVPEGDPVNSLDVAILQNNVLRPLFGIEDPRSSTDIDFIGGIRGLKELVRRCDEDCCAAFALYPTGMDQLMAIADAGEVMPPKSTWFEPKLRSGMVVRKYD